MLTAALDACGREPALDQLAAGERGRVVEARSGGVVVLASGLVVRLAGVDPPGWDGAWEAAARAALDRLTSGREIDLLYGGANRDGYGRAVAQLRVREGRVWVQQALLEQGLVLVRTHADNRALATAMLAAEARARAARRGLWARAGAVLLPEEVGPATSGFRIVEGRVRRGGSAHGRIYLDFSADGRGFAVEAPARALGDFRQAGKAPEALAGRLVRARGVVSGEVMRLDHPEAVELLRES